jgi:long-subunit fatty acid transport protein
MDFHYSSASNIKLGAELRVHPQLSLRGGYAYYGSPLTDSSKDASKEYLTLGFGLKVNQYFFDFAMINSSNQNYLEIYPNSESAILKNTNGQFLVSGGFKF